MNRHVQFSVGEFYHLYNKDNNKQKIFLDESDRNRFIKLLFLCNGNNPVVMKFIPAKDVFLFNRGKILINIGVYCLMSNHFHFLVREKYENGISQFMKKLSTAYSMYFNKKNKRAGSLFEGPFKAQHVDEDEYLEYLYAYIHLNPVKMLEPQWKIRGIQNIPRAVDFLKKYYYSSYLDFLGSSREENAILNVQSFPNYFSTKNDFESLMRSFLSYESTISA